MNEDRAREILTEAEYSRLALDDLREITNAAGRIAEGLANATVVGMTLLTAPDNVRRGLVADLLDHVGGGMRDLEQMGPHIEAITNLYHGRARMLKAEVDEHKGDDV